MTFDLDAWLASAPPVPPIVAAGAPVLRRRAEEVPDLLFGTPVLGDLVNRMVEVMRKAPGVGLAAPQIGVPLRVFVAEDTEERMTRLTPDGRALRRRTPLPLTVLVNPEVRPIGGDRALFFEGCLSVPGYGALVDRFLGVDVTALHPSGQPLSLHLEGWPARIMQHEIDHLDGTLYVDRMLSRTFASDPELVRWSGVAVDEVLLALDNRKLG
ncbi:MAG: peptide deformylase [Polyangiaceae bacterium]|jgi:peptide deformylase